MTEAEAYDDRVREGYEKLAEARRKAVFGDIQEAKKLYQEVIRIFSSLGEAPEGSRFFGMDDFESVVRKAGRALEEIADEEYRKLNEQAEEHAGRADELKGAYERIKEEIKGIRENLKELETPSIHTVHIDASEAEKTIERLKEPTESIHTIHVRTIQESRPGGLVQALARGGRIPGWGGGDRVRALLEPGEFVIRKEAVRRYGAGLFELLNSLKLNLPRIPAPAVPRMQPAFQSGGLVAGAPLLGRLELALPGGESIEVFAFEREVKRLEKVLARANKTR